MIIDGPASLPYEVDLGAFPITDWYYEPADTIATQVMDANHPLVPNAPGAPPPSDNVLFNGKNVNMNGGGEYQKVTLTRGKRHRLRLINTSVENTFTVSLVGHTMTVIANDFVPVNSYTVDSLYLGVGQRFDVTIDASQPVGNYWFNVTFSNTQLCGTSKNPFPAAIFHYEGAPNTLPTNKGKVPADSLCQDMSGLSPVVSRSAPSAQFQKRPDNDLPIAFEVNKDQSRVFWKVNNTAVDVLWDRPTLRFVEQMNTNFPTSLNVIPIPNKDQVRGICH
jgi:FtsP/CotA-like multicopper oxidase with cupredoxin domain